MEWLKKFFNRKKKLKNVKLKINSNKIDEKELTKREKIVLKKIQNLNKN